MTRPLAPDPTCPPLPRRPIPDEQGYTRRVVSGHLIREHQEHIEAARVAIAQRMEVPVGVIVVDWEKVRKGVPGVVVQIKRRAA